MDQLMTVHGHSEIPAFLSLHWMAVRITSYRQISLSEVIRKSNHGVKDCLSSFSSYGFTCTGALQAAGGFQPQNASNAKESFKAISQSSAAMNE
jgi:hypothetical protein